MDTATNTIARTITGADVREIAAAARQEVIMIHDCYKRHFPYDKQELLSDISLMLLFDMCEKIKVQFYEYANGEKVERLSYEFAPGVDPAAVHTPPGDFPRFTIPDGWRVRIVATHTKRKPEAEVTAFFRELGWSSTDPLTRTGQGTTETYGSFRSPNGLTMRRDFYKDFPVEDTDHTNQKGGEV